MNLHKNSSSSSSSSSSLPSSSSSSSSSSFSSSCSMISAFSNLYFSAAVAATTFQKTQPKAFIVRIHFRIQIRTIKFQPFQIGNPSLAETQQDILCSFFHAFKASQKPLSGPNQFKTSEVECASHMALELPFWTMRKRVSAFFVGGIIVKVMAGQPTPPRNKALLRAY